MKTIEIKNRWTGAVMHAVQVEDGDQYAIRTAVSGLVARGANLSDANLSGANLSDANLRDANLSGANLSDANLRDAYLRDANLSGANLSDANLRDANLSGANLSGANLSDANLRDANLSGANLSDANLRDANLSGANLSDANLRDAYLRDANLSGANLSDANLSDANLRGANLSGALHYEDVPKVPRLDSKILSLIEAGEGELAMGDWHACETTHCRAGWAIHLAGAAGYALEKKLGSEVAGAFIYHRSTGRIPNFFDTDEGALADIVACAKGGAP